MSKESVDNNPEKTTYDKAKACDEYLAKSGATDLVVSLSESSHIYNVKFDGSTELDFKYKTRDEIRRRIAACREAYEHEGIIGNIIDIMVDFALESFDIVHSSPEIQNFHINWARKVGLYRLSEQILKCFYRDGNVPILMFRGIIPSSEVTELKKTVANTTKGQDAFIEEIIEKSAIPRAYEVLDVLNIYKSGSELLGSVRYEYAIPKEDMKILKSPRTPEEKAAVQKFKDSFGIDEFDDLLKRGRIILDTKRLSILYYKKDAYSQWASPMLWRVMSDVRFKKLLRNMDISVAESILNSVQIFRLGDTAAGMIPATDKIATFAKMLKNPSKSKQMVWDDLIDIVSDYPPVDKILGKAKYDQVNDDIRSGLGIAEILVNGQGGNYANSFLSVKTLLERLETGRQHLLDWLNEQLLMIARNMGFRKPAIVRPNRISLVDEEAEKRILLELVDRNIVSYQTTVERFGENFDVELKRMQEEDRTRKRVQDETPFAILKTGKFGPIHQDGPITLGSMVKDEEVDVSLKNTPPSSQEINGPLGGRPGGTKRRQKKMITPRKKPQGSSISDLSINQDLIKTYSDKFEKVFNLLAGALCKSNQYTKLEEIKENELITINDATIKILLHLSKDEDITVGNISQVLADTYKLTTAPPKLDRCVRDVVKQRVSQFRKKKGRAPNKKELKDITSSAFAICTAQLKKTGDI